MLATPHAVGRVHGDQARFSPLYGALMLATCGQTWSPPRRETVRGFPYHAARLISGRVLLAYGYRFDPMGVRARLLNPECEDIGGATELVLRDDGKSTDLGYPHVLPLPNGTALVTYYHDSGDGTRHVAATLIGEH